MSALDKIIEEYESLEKKLFSGECLDELKSRLKLKLNSTMLGPKSFVL